ncbi:MAG: hypothetical protein EZS28_004514 [Streblomastix strix]|uniref:Uncharacterized protein n=1 Tax=Streblomastix strix TaxID=222440 RepID=A0A5J4WXY5_9EUKA|nr:MAG: hypothetical protein EZS28_004514 [Streblomastix strix]
MVSIRCKRDQSQSAENSTKNSQQAQFQKQIQLYSKFNQLTDQIVEQDLVATIEVVLKKQVSKIDALNYSLEPVARQKLFDEISWSGANIILPMPEIGPLLNEEEQNYATRAFKSSVAAIQVKTMLINDAARNDTDNLVGKMLKVFETSLISVSDHKIERESRLKGIYQEPQTEDVLSQRTKERYLKKTGKQIIIRKENLKTHLADVAVKIEQENAIERETNSLNKEEDLRGIKSVHLERSSFDPEQMAKQEVARWERNFLNPTIQHESTIVRWVTIPLTLKNKSRRTIRCKLEDQILESMYAPQTIQTVCLANKDLEYHNFQTSLNDPTKLESTQPIDILAKNIPTHLSQDSSSSDLIHQKSPPICSYITDEETIPGMVNRFKFRLTIIDNNQTNKNEIDVRQMEKDRSQPTDGKSKNLGEFHRVLELPEAPIKEMSNLLVVLNCNEKQTCSSNNNSISRDPSDRYELDLLWCNDEAVLQCTRKEAAIPCAIRRSETFLKEKQIKSLKLETDNTSTAHNINQESDAVPLTQRFKLDPGLIFKISKLRRLLITQRGLRGNNSSVEGLYINRYVREQTEQEAQMIRQHHSGQLDSDTRLSVTPMDGRATILPSSDSTDPSNSQQRKKADFLKTRGRMNIVKMNLPSGELLAVRLEMIENKSYFNGSCRKDSSQKLQQSKLLRDGIVSGADIDKEQVNLKTHATNIDSNACRTAIRTLFRVQCFQEDRTNGFALKQIMKKPVAACIKKRREELILTEIHRVSIDQFADNQHLDLYLIRKYTQHLGLAVRSRQEMKRIETNLYGCDLKIIKFLPMRYLFKVTYIIMEVSGGVTIQEINKGSSLKDGPSTVAVHYDMILNDTIRLTIINFE